MTFEARDLTGNAGQGRFDVIAALDAIRVRDEAGGAIRGLTTSPTQCTPVSIVRGGDGPGICVVPRIMPTMRLIPAHCPPERHLAILAAMVLARYVPIAGGIGLMPMTSMIDGLEPRAVARP